MLRRRTEPLVTRKELDGLIAMVMRIDENVERILRAVEEDDGKEEEDRS